MPSLIPGYEYDIFISYRQKDNKGDRWVSEFVEALKTELESTFKEEISVYFDINPIDCLLESHDVDASLKEKLKCLVFIPIISRTYCDPKSFAWEHEFKAFVEQASQDQFGLKIKLPNGNVASRVLPVRIHELDSEDIKLCESITGGFLRGIEFIYKEPGVNKPLTSDDDEKKNLNNTKYRIQINKVANAIKEIISGLKNETGKELIKQTEPLKETQKEGKKEEQEKPAMSINGKLISVIAVLAVIILAVIIGYPKIFKRNTLEKLRSSGERISVAVMPFQNMTNDTTWNIWQNVIQDMLVIYLSNSPQELMVRQTESINSLVQRSGLSRNKPITITRASNISLKLDANILIYGSIIKAGSKMRVSAQLIDANTEETIRTFEIEAPFDEEVIFPVADSLKHLIRNSLIISKLGIEVTPDFQQYISTFSPEAYKYFIMGNDALNNRDYPAAFKMYSNALALDSNFVLPAITLSIIYKNLGLFEQGKSISLRVYRKIDKMPVQQKLMAKYVYSLYFQTPNESIRNLKEFLKIDDQSTNVHQQLGLTYFYGLQQYEDALLEFEKVFEIYKKWGLKPNWVYDYTMLGYAYHKTGRFKKEKRLYEIAVQEFPDDPALISQMAILALTEGDSIVANHFIEKYQSISRANLLSDVKIVKGTGDIYYDAGINDKAEYFYRKTLALDPKNKELINNLAYFLIDKEKNLVEGFELVRKALELSPENYSFLHTLGLGLYKQGKYQEALEVLQKSWDLRVKNAIYNHEAYLHLEAAKKAVAGMK